MCSHIKTFGRRNSNIFCSSSNTDTAHIGMMVHSNKDNLIHIDDVTPSDIKSGRGGHASNHPSHQKFLDYKDFLRRLYKVAQSNREKRAIQQMLVDYVHEQLGGRFIRQVHAKYYIEINDREALKKAASALRDDRIRHRDEMSHGSVILENGFDNVGGVFDFVKDGFGLVDDGFDFVDGTDDIAALESIHPLLFCDFHNTTENQIG